MSHVVCWRASRYIRLSQQGKAKYPFSPCLSCTYGIHWGEMGGDHRSLGVPGGHDEPSYSQEGNFERAELLTNLMVDGKNWMRNRHHHHSKCAHLSMCSIEEDFEFISARW